MNVSQHHGAAPGLTPVFLINRIVVLGCPDCRREKSSGMCMAAPAAAQ